MVSLIQEHAIYSRYFAPRGKERLIFLGEQISHRHLTHNDRLIGILGDAGSGKSSLIKGMFPGLELSNDDDIINPRTIMQVRNFADIQDASAYHLDIRFQMAFTQMHEIVDFVVNALGKKKRVVIEHFDLLYPALKMNADIIVGIGEEIIVTRPSIFGPLPSNIYNIVHESLKYRKMAHTVEDITIKVLKDEFGVYDDMFYSSDVKRGFVLRFVKENEIDLRKVSESVANKIAENLPISYIDDEHISIGESLIYCTGPRLHLKSTSEVESFCMVDSFIRDDKTKTFCLVTLVGTDSCDINNLNKLIIYR